MKIHLNKLELHGFKSFPEKTVIKFHKGITVVVGPNGCGKSNIVDALLWVLGEQKIKNLRGENNEDLIFSGSASKKPLGMTEVGITFTNSKDDVFIARRFFRSGESKYILNEKYCRNKDIQDELYNLNLGGRNYFIFEQGSIEKLVSLKPSERRMLIEEAAGISQYLVRKKETANKLIIAEQNLDSIEMLSADKEKRLRDLKNQANYASRYRSLKADSIEHTKVFLYKKYKKLNSEFEKRKSEVEKFLNSEMLLTKELSAIEKEYSDFESKKWELDRKLKENQKDLYELNQDILTKKSEVEKLKQREEFITQRISENKKSIEDSNSLIKKKEKQIEELGSKIALIKKEYESSLNEFNLKKDEIEKFKAEFEKITNEKNLIKNNLFSLNSQLSGITNEIHDNEKRAVKLENEIYSKNQFIKELKQNIARRGSSVEENKLRESESAFLKGETNLQSIKKDLDEIKTTVYILTSEIQKIENEINGLKKQREKYVEMKGKVSDTRYGKNRKLQDVLDSKKENFNLIESFYFDEIGSFIMENDNDPEDPELEKLILNIPSRQHIPTGVEDMDGFIDHIKNLFTLKDPDLMKILKDGVVVSDLKRGLQIFKKFKTSLVTLNGEIITGDGVLIRKRRSGILDILEEIKKIDLAVTESEKKLKKLKWDLTTSEEKEKKLSIRFTEESQSVKQLERESIRLKSDYDNFIKSKENDLKRVRILESELERHNTDLIKFREDSKIRSEERKILEKKNDDLIKDRESIDIREANFNRDINLREKDYFRLENKMNLAKEKLNSEEAELKRLKSEKNSLSNDIERKTKETTELKAEISVIGKQILEFKTLGNSSIDKKGKSEEFIKGNEIILNELSTEIKKRNELLTKKRIDLETVREAKSREEIELAALKKDIFSLEEISFRELNIELGEISPDDNLLELALDELEEKVNTSNEKLIKMRDSNKLNFSAESEYEILEKEHGVLISQKSDVLNSIEDMNRAIKKIDDESKASFKGAFEEIRGNFKRNFQILFEGGEADMTLTDVDNLLETGLEIMAQPPGKRLQGLRLLSGGEKTLTSLAFLFALFEYKPSPFCVFDEVDASLDEANIQRFLKFLHKLKEKTQFLIITHNFKTMEEADYIYGISMNEPGISTIYSMKMTSGNNLIPK